MLAHNTLKTYIKLWVNIYYYLKSKTVISQLQKHSSPLIQAIGLSIKDTLLNTISLVEKEGILLIEQRRQDLLNSKEIIEVIDYGAGHPNSNRTMDDMKKGVKSNVAVANICQASKSPFWAKFLSNLIKNLKPECILELGTCVGISTSYQALAMKGNQKGVIYTLEGAPEIAKVAVETVTILGLAELTEIIVGPFHTTLPILLEKIKPIDIFFNDGHHSYDAVLQYFEQVYPYLADQAVMIIDDISWSDGMQKAWQELVSDSRITVSVNLCSLGIVLISKEQSKKEKYNLQITK